MFSYKGCQSSYKLPFNEKIKFCTLPFGCILNSMYIEEQEHKAKKSKLQSVVADYIKYWHRVTITVHTGIRLWKRFPNHAGVNCLSFFCHICSQNNLGKNTEHIFLSDRFYFGSCRNWKIKGYGNERKKAERNVVFWDYVWKSMCSVHTNIYVLHKYNKELLVYTKGTHLFIFNWNSILVRVLQLRCYLVL